MKKKICLIVLISLWAIPAFPIQVADTAWVRRYNGPGNDEDYAKAMAIDDSGNVYVTGHSWADGTAHDYATIKYDAAGNELWVKRYNYYGPGGHDLAFAIALDGSNNIYVTGYSFGTEATLDYATIKYEPNGDTAWVRRYNGPGNGVDVAYAIAVDGLDNIYVTGWSVGSGTGDDYATIKYDSNGDTAWVRRYNGPGNDLDQAYSIAVDGSSNVCVTGWSLGSGTNGDYATIRYYPDGDTAWVRRYDGPGNGEDNAQAIAIDGSGNVYVTGWSYGSGTYDDYATTKYYPDGDTAWVRRYNGAGNVNDQAHAIALDDKGDVYVTGRSWGNGTGYDCVTIKYDGSEGTELWKTTYNNEAENGNECGWAITLDGSGDVYVTAESWGGSTDYDYVTMKYDTSGNEVWVQRYNGPGNEGDRTFAIDVDDSGNVYVTGLSVGSGTYMDYATIKYIQYDSIPFAPAVNYPAGDHPHSVFCADLDGDGDLDITVADDFGGKVYVLKNDGSGSFLSSDSVMIGANLSYGFPADLDGDSDLDLVVTAHHLDSLYVLKNDGNAVFEIDSGYFAGSDPVHVSSADLDGDHDLDIVVANYDIDSISIFKNNGNGSFHDKVNYQVGSGPRSTFCADLDADGDRDIAIANVMSNNVSVLKNDGEGAFPDLGNYLTGSMPQYVFCADLDGDEDLDLVTANSGDDSISVLKNNGDATFPVRADYAVGSYPISVFGTDLDGDSHFDLAVANYHGDNISILKNKGDGTFQNKVDYDVLGAPISIFCADLDGEGDFDLAVSNYNSDSISILRNLTQVPANQPPWAFSLISPADEDTTSDSVTFRWQTPYDPNFGDQIRYDLHLSTELDFNPDSTVVYDSLPLSKVTGTLDIDTYYWKVRAYDNWGAERWSTETWSFYFAPSCGDANSDGKCDISDAVYLILYLFKDGTPPLCPPEPYASCADANGDGEVTISDVVYLINYLLKGGEPPIC